MTLRQRTLLTIGAIGLALMVVLYALASTFLLRSLTELEEEDAKEGTRRITQLLEDTLLDLNLLTRDWASWDDTYTFVQDGNQAYIEANLVPQTFVNLRLNLLLVVRSDGQVVFGSGFDPLQESMVPLPDGLAELISADSPLARHSGAGSNRSGILLLPAGPLLVSSWPILPSSEEGIVRGALLMGRFIDQAEIDRLARLSGLSFRLFLPDDPSLPLDCAMARASLHAQAPVIAQPLNDETMAGYTLLDDIDGNPALLLRVTIPRIHYRQGYSTMPYLLAALAFVTLVFAFAILGFVERSVLRPISRLSAEVSRIRNEGDLSKRVSVSGHDELAGLATSINGMLEALDVSFSERRQAEDALQRRTEQLEALHQVGLDLATQLNLEDLLRSIVIRAIHLLGADDGGLYLHHPDRDVLERVVSVGDTIPVGSVLRRGEGLSGRVWETGRPLVVDDYQHWEGRADIYQSEPSMAVLGVPIRWGEKLLGILNVAARPPHRFTSADVELLSLFATQAAVALENARLYGDLQQRMEQLKSTQAQLIQSARLVAVGELAAGVAHQLNNSLTPILGYTELLAESMGADSPYRGDLQRIEAKARQACEIVKNLLDFARQMKPQKQMAHINEVLRKTLALIRVQLERAGLCIEETYATDLDMLPVDISQIGQVFLNLINNAAQAMPQGGTLRLHTYRSGSWVAVAFSDTGPGIPAEVQQRLFEPFFTTHPGRAGLGLAVSLGIVQEHGGRIEVQSTPGQGSTFTVWLPLDEGVVGSEPRQDRPS